MKAKKLMLPGFGVASFETNFYTRQTELSLTCALKSGTFHEIKIACNLRPISQRGYLSSFILNLHLNSACLCLSVFYYINDRVCMLGRVYSF